MDLLEVDLKFIHCSHPVFLPEKLADEIQVILTKSSGLLEEEAEYREMQRRSRVVSGDDFIVRILTSQFIQL
jgi:hypothetical protein